MEIIKQQKALNKAVLAIKRGGVIICPTDTVYGFLADATNKKAVDKIFKIKKRLKQKPLAIFIQNFKTAKSLALINKDQENFLKKIWPGKVTVVLKRKAGVKLYGVDKKTIAIRIPKYKFLNNLLKKINKPLVQTSVNISSKDPLDKMKDILTVFGKNNLVSLIIDAGDVKNSKPSKIIDLSQVVLTRLR